MEEALDLYLAWILQKELCRDKLYKDKRQVIPKNNKVKLDNHIKLKRQQISPDPDNQTLKFHKS